MIRDLRPIPLDEAVKAMTGGRQGGARMITMGIGQWDDILAAAYERGWILLELDRHERPVRAYQRKDVSQ